nr:COMT protein [Stephania japonica]
MASSQTEIGTKKDEEDFLFAMQLASGSVLPMVLQAAIELQVLEIIAKAGHGAHLSPKEIVSQIPTHNLQASDMLDRILRLLASHSILTCVAMTRENGNVERKYGLATVCKYLLPNADGVSFSPLIFLNQSKAYMESYLVKEAVLEGGASFKKAHGVYAFEYASKEPRFNELFNQAMYDHTTIIMKKILETYKGFEDLKELVDVGGGIGTTIGIITSKYPAIKGINFDLPHVIEHAPSIPVKHVGGDMFTSVPKGEWILHDWSDEHCLKLLKNCYDALPSNGKLIVVEEVLPVIPETDNASKAHCQMDLIMMALHIGGRERMDKEFEVMAVGAGFEGIRKGSCLKVHSHTQYRIKSSNNNCQKFSG